MDSNKLKGFMTPAEIDEFTNLANSQREFLMCVDHWTSEKLRDAIKEGRITRHGASTMFHALIDAVTQVCHDFIAPPTE